MWADVVVQLKPFVDDDLGLPGGIEPLCVQDFVAERSIEAFLYPFSQGESEWI